MNIRELAQELTTVSPLMVGKEKETLETIADGSTVVAINAVDLFEMNEEEVCVFTIEEEENKFFFGGIVLKNLVNNLLDKSSLTLDEMNKLLNETPLEVVFTRAKTKKNRDITKITII